MNVSLKLEGVDTVLKRLEGFPKLQERAQVNALNVLARAAQKEAKKGILEEYNITSRSLGEGIGLLPARGGLSGKQRLFAVITARGKRVPLYKFGAIPQKSMQKGVPVNSRRPVTVKVLRKGGRHEVFPDRLTGRKPFVATMTTGFWGSDVNHTGIFVRTRKMLLENVWRNRENGVQTGVRKHAYGARHELIREVMAEGIPGMFMKIGGEAMRNLVMVRGARVLWEKVSDQIKKK